VVLLIYISVCLLYVFVSCHALANKRIHYYFIYQTSRFLRVKDVARSRHEDRKVAEFPFTLLVGFVERKKRGEVQEGEEVEKIKGVGEGDTGMEVERREEIRFS